MSTTLLDAPGCAVIEDIRGAYAPSSRLREAVRHLHSDLSEDVLAPAPPVAKAREPVANESTSRPRVLLYSTAPTLRLYLCACLSTSYTLDDTSDVQYHLQQSSFSRPDLIITDLVTLERTRFSLLELREPARPLADIPLLLLSQEPNTQLKCPPSAGPDHVLSIPVMPDRLRDTVHALAGSPRPDG